MPFFSVIIPLYNKENHIKATLESVLSQTFNDFEVIVIDDGSTDGSAAEVSKIEDERIKLFNIENHGVSHARNFGVQQSNSDFIAFLDADDLWKPFHLENLKSLYDEFPNCGMYATAYESQFGDKMIASHYYRIPKKRQWSGIVWDFFELSSINCIASSSSVMIPKTIYNGLNGFDTSYNSGEDIDLWIRMALCHSIAFNNEPSVTINMLADNQASKKSIQFKNHLNFDSFEQEDDHSSLKKYLDLNRFALAISHKLEGNIQEANLLVSKIDKNSLNLKQRLLLKMNTNLLQNLMRFKDTLRKNGIGLSAFR